MSDDIPLREKQNPPAPAGRAINRDFLFRIAENIFEHANPLEVLGDILSDPEAGLIMLVAIVVFTIAFVAVVVFLGGVWEAVQQAFLGGGPPQGLGLK